jgi:hypothetical protein
MSLTAWLFTLIVTGGVIWWIVNWVLQRFKRMENEIKDLQGVPICEECDRRIEGEDPVLLLAEGLQPVYDDGQIVTMCQSCYDDENPDDWTIVEQGGQPA